jgi:hypothetical protein
MEFAADDGEHVVMISGVASIRQTLLGTDRDVCALYFDYTTNGHGRVLIHKYILANS